MDVLRPAASGGFTRCVVHLFVCRLKRVLVGHWLTGAAALGPLKAASTIALLGRVGGGFISVVHSGRTDFLFYNCVVHFYFMDSGLYYSNKA